MHDCWHSWKTSVDTKWPWDLQIGPPRWLLIDDEWIRHLFICNFVLIWQCTLKIWYKHRKFYTFVLFIQALSPFWVNFPGALTNVCWAPAVLIHSNGKYMIRSIWNTDRYTWWFVGVGVKSWNFDVYTHLNNGEIQFIILRIIIFISHWTSEWIAVVRLRPAQKTMLQWKKSRCSTTCLRRPEVSVRGVE